MQTENFNFNKKTQQAGFSLIELLVAMLISLTLIFACTALYSSLKSSIQTAQRLATAQESLRGAYYILSRSLRQADSFTINGTSDALETTNSTAEINLYGCLGNDIASGSTPTDSYSLAGVDDYQGLYCNNELIALGVTELNFVKINDYGLKVTMEIEGMPTTMINAGGLTFTLALRQKILLK